MCDPFGDADWLVGVSFQELDAVGVDGDGGG